MLFGVLEALMAFQMQGSIFALEKGPSTGKVCPTARYEKRTPANIE
jgi:hypothetical protein